MMLHARVLLAALLLFVGARAALADDQVDQKKLQQQAWDNLTGAMLQDCVDTVAKIKTWRDSLRKIQDDYQKDNDADTYAARQVSWAADVDAYFSGRSPEFLQLLGWKDRVAKAKANIDDDADASVKAQLASFYSDQIFPLVDAIQDPVKQAQGFLQTWANQNMVITAGPVTFQLKGFDAKTFTVSPFKAGASLELDLTYQPGDIHATATGLYFKPDGTPVLDNVKLKDSPADILKKEVMGAIVNNITGADLPVATIRKISWVDFTDTTSARGGFKFTLDLKLGDAVDWLPSLTIENVLLRTNGTLDLGRDGAIDTGPLAEPVIPIGSSGFVLTGHTISYTPAKHTGTLKTQMVPIAFQENPSQSPTRFELQITLDLPLTQVGIQGTFYLGSEGIGSLDGTISDKAADFKLTMPSKDAQSSPSGKILNGTIALHLDSKELTGNGHVQYLEALGATAQFVIGFNGYGSFSAQTDPIADLNASASISGSYTPGFKRVKLQGAFTMDIPLQFMDLTAALNIQADTAGDPEVVVSVQAMGLPPLTLKLPKMSDLTLQKLADALNQSQQQFLDAVGKLFSDAAKDGEALAGRWGQEISSTAKQLGGDISSGAKQLGGDISSGAKQLGGDISSGAKQLGGDISSGTQQLGGDISSGLSSAFSLRSASFPSVSSLSLTDDGISAINRLSTAQTQQAHLEARLAPLLNDLGRVAIHRSTLGSKGMASASELRLRLRHCVAAPEGQDGAVVAFSIEVSSFQHDLDPRRAARPQVISDIKPGRIHFRGMFGKGRPDAQLDIPALQHVSTWSADDLLWAAVSAILTRRMPNAIEPHRQTERLLAVRNDTGERLTVYAQTRLANGTLIPSAGNTEFFYVPPDGKSHVLYLKGAPMPGVSALIWAKGTASGRVWEMNRTKQFWLVDEFEGNQGRHYYAPSPEVFVYRFTSSKEGAAKAKAAIDKARQDDIRKRAELARQKEAARQKAIQDAVRRKAEAEANAARIAREAEEAKLREKANAERIRRMAEEARLKEQAEAKAKANAERIRREAEEARLKAESEAKAKANADRIRREAEEAKLKEQANAERIRRMAEEARLKAEAEAKAKANAERIRREAEETRRKAEAEANAARIRREAEEAKLKERANAERIRKMAEDARRRAEAEANAAHIRQQAEEAKRRAEAEANAERIRRQAEDARRKAEAEANAERIRRQAEEARRRAEAEANAERIRRQAEDARRRAEAEANAERLRRQAEEAARQEELRRQREAWQRQQAELARQEELRRQQQERQRQEAQREQQERERQEAARRELERQQQEWQRQQQLRAQQEEWQRQQAQLAQQEHERQEEAERQEAARQEAMRQELARQQAVRWVVVPNVHNMDYNSAVRLIQSSGLGVRYYGNNRSRVIGQNPFPGTRLQRGSIVNISFPNQR